MQHTSPDSPAEAHATSPPQGRDATGTAADATAASLRSDSSSPGGVTGDDQGMGHLKEVDTKPEWPRGKDEGMSRGKGAKGEGGRQAVGSGGVHVDNPQDIPFWGS